MAIPTEIDLQHLPQHVAIIMDGNGRWAKEQGKLRVFGHQNGVKAVKDTVEGAVELGLKYLTLYAFSTENWNRPQQEVNALMEILVKTITKETATLMKHQIRLNAIGDLTSLPPACYQELMEAMEKTSTNARCTLTLALSYSSRWELTEAVKTVAKKVQAGELAPEDINEQLLSNHLTTIGLPDPELMIRTSGELRLSNFMMWQLAYTELYFTPKLWPDFRRSDLHEAILDFQKRERRFGKISE
jgi:undecaprenyl diphosphate synthase